MGGLVFRSKEPSEKLLRTLLNVLKHKLESGQYNLESCIRISLAEGLKHKCFEKLPLRLYLRTRLEIINNIDASSCQNYQETNNTIDIKEGDLEQFCNYIFHELRDKDNISPEYADSWYKNGFFYAKHINYFKNKVSSALWYDFHLVFLISYTFSYKKCKPLIPNHLIENKRKNTANSICEATTSRETTTSNKRKAASLPAELPLVPKQKKTSISANVIQVTTEPVVDIFKKLVLNVEKIDEKFETKDLANIICKATTSRENQNRKRTTKKANKTEVPTPIVVDINKKLVYNVEKVGEEFGTIGHIIKIHKEAKKFEPQVALFCSTDGSLEYCVLDANLMKLKELLDKIKCSKDDVHKRQKKIEVIEYTGNS